MFSKLAVLITAVLATSAVAWHPARAVVHNSCNTGPVVCCNSLNAPESEAATKAIGLVNVGVPVTALVGTQCSPLEVIGVSKGASCSAGPVCCEQNFANELIGVNCSPVSVA